MDIQSCNKSVHYWNMTGFVTEGKTDARPRALFTQDVLMYKTQIVICWTAVFENADGQRMMWRIWHLVLVRME